MELRDPAIALAHDGVVRVLGGHCSDRHQDVGCPDAAVGPVTMGGRLQAGEHLGQRVGHQAHHRAAGGVERAGCYIGHAGLDGGLRRGAHLVDRRHRLDPDDIGTAIAQTFHLLAE